MESLTASPRPIEDRENATLGAQRNTSGKLCDRVSPSVNDGPHGAVIARGSNIARLASKNLGASVGALMMAPRI